MRMKALVALLALWTAVAAAEISPQGIIVNPSPGKLSVKVWVDRDPVKRGDAVYRVGDPIQIYVSVTEEAYVYLFDVKADGEVQQFFPNSYDQQNRLRAGEVRRLPPPGAGYRFTVDGPAGRDTILAIAVKQPISARALGDLARGEISVRGLRALSEALSIAVRPLATTAWATDSVSFRVVDETPRSSLWVRSSPSGAQVFLDGVYRGRTPLDLRLAPGRYNLELRLEGYKTYQVVIRLTEGRTVRVNARLTPLLSELRVETSVRARVFLDGYELGWTQGGTLVKEVEPGRRWLVVLAPGYAPYVQRIDLEAGQSTVIWARLVPVRPGMDMGH